MTTTCFYLDTPFSGLRIECSDEQLLGIDFTRRGGKVERLESNPLAARIAVQIARYCESPAAGFDLPLAPLGTDFQQRVWRAMLAIPPGEVRSYGDIARQLGSSARAVGNACRANPIPLVIPCHRVVAASGIGGFAGQTAGARLAIKRRLLQHEGVGSQFNERRSL